MSNTDLEENPAHLGDYRGRESEVDPHEIVRADLRAISGCDVVLANCWRPSYGTAMELAIAQREHCIPVITVVPDMRTVSPWLMEHSSKVVGSLADGIQAVMDMDAQSKGQGDA